MSTILSHCHPNAIVERSNPEILKHLRHLAHDFSFRDMTLWPSYLPLVQRIVNATPNALTTLAPAQIVYGNRIFIDRGLLQPFSTAAAEINSDFVKQLSATQDCLLEQIKLAQQEYISVRQKDDPPDCSVGALVLIPFPARPNTSAVKWQGPFEVVSRDSKHTKGQQ
jgi:hypothetical protein